MQRYIIPALILITLACFWRAANGQFVWVDDEVYVHSNPRVQEGLKPANIVWAFTNSDNGYSHPLTWLSLMLDSTLFGSGPRGYHTTNIILHALAVVLLYLALKALTGGPWRSALVALLFAIHPLRVESVAWISERKDMLSGCFAFATLLAYAYYARRPHGGRYLLVAVLFILGLLSKPILVTLPCLLLLLDIWPLRRLSWVAIAPSAAAVPPCPPRSLPFLILEKIPLLLLSAIDSVAAYILQAKDGFVLSRDQVPLSMRLANIPISNARYLAKMVWFRGLFFKYDFQAWPGWEVAAATGLLLAITAAVCIRFRRYPWLAVGWFWYLGMLVPVSGLITVGYLAMADRYTYIPAIGLLIMLAWSLPDRLGRTEAGRLALGGAVLAICVVLAGFTWRQIGYWHDKIVLYTHALQFAPRDSQILDALALTLDTEMGRPDLAMPIYRKAVEVAPGSAAAQFDLGSLLDRLGRSDEAWTHMKLAVRGQPDSAFAHHILGVMAMNDHRLDDAMREFEKAVEINHAFAPPFYNMGNILYSQHRLGEALERYRQGFRLDPTDAESCFMAGKVLMDMGNIPQALPYLREAARLRPDVGVISETLGQALMQIHDWEEGVTWLQKAVQLDTKNAQYRAALAEARAGKSPPLDVNQGPAAGPATQP